MSASSTTLASLGANMDYGSLLATLRSLSTFAMLPIEILENICGPLHPPPACQVIPWTALTGVSTLLHPAAKPPADGTCRFLELPVEIRKEIFASSLPARNVVIEPTCGRLAHSKSSSRTPWPNRTSNLMLINKKIKSEIAEFVYEERIFKIHVHQDLDDGGIEFLDAGRQPLQYQADPCDNRFTRFGDGDEFGFSRVKKVVIAIFPASGDIKHCTTSTYYMNLALVKLLERSGGEKNMINSITITFPRLQSDIGHATRRDMMRSEHFWWDPDAKEPRSTSVFGVSDIELVLRPFANLRSHMAYVALPSELSSHEGTCHFVATLRQCMETGAFIPGDDFDDRMSRQRGAFEDYLFARKHGAKPVNNYKWTDQDWYKEDDEDDQDTPKRRKVWQDDGEVDGGTAAMLEGEDPEEQNVLLQHHHARLEALQTKLKQVVGGSWRLGNDDTALTTGRSILVSLAADRHNRAAPRSASLMEL